MMMGTLCPSNASKGCFTLSYSNWNRSFVNSDAVAAKFPAKVPRETSVAFSHTSKLAGFAFRFTGARRKRSSARVCLSIHYLGMETWEHVVVGVCLLALLTAGIAALAIITQPTWMVQLLQKLIPDVLFIKPTEERIMALTIDDSPHKEITEKILQILKDNECKATFFIIGSNMDESPELVHRIIREGHEVGNHTMHDSPSWLLSSEEFENQLLQVDNKLKEFFVRDLDNMPLKWFRPGHGIYTKRMVDIAKAYGYRTVLGSLFPFDTNFRNMGKYIAKYLLWKAHNGAIIILHDREPQAKQTPEILRLCLPKLKADGYSIVTLSELLCS